MILDLGFLEFCGCKDLTMDIDGLFYLEILKE
jgi:hypothetical protein